MKYPIVQPYLPPIDKYQQSVSDIFQRNYLTNNGPLLQLLERRLSEYLNVDYLLLVANGTLALQVAYEALNITGQVITTPFSFAATASSLCWQKIDPIFADIDKCSFNLDIDAISKECISNASALLPVHVFGNPCCVASLECFAKQHNLKVIYDAAHAFATKLNGQSILSYGDAATISLHATKLFHSVEGGAIIFKRRADYIKAKQLINFGFNNKNYPEYIGINAKMSEFHAAMGLAVLDDIEYIVNKRKTLYLRYSEKLSGVKGLVLQHWHDSSEPVGAYMPIVLPDEKTVLLMMERLTKAGIQTRRYFYPSLAECDIYNAKSDCSVANNIARCILCLPMYTDLTLSGVDEICDMVKSILTHSFQY